MAGIDYSLASLEQREQFALTQSRQKEVLSLLKNQPGVAGAVLLCTCNRTELYLSCQEDLDPDPFLLLCRQLGIQPERVESLFRRRQGEEVFWHLGRLACGAKARSGGRIRSSPR